MFGRRHKIEPTAGGALDMAKAILQEASCLLGRNRRGCQSRLCFRRSPK